MARRSPHLVPLVALAVVLVPAFPPAVSATPGVSTPRPDTVWSGEAPAAPGTIDFRGIVKLSNCSASVVRYPTSRGTDPALVLTNGHCYEKGMPAQGKVHFDVPSTARMTLLDSAGKSLGTLQAKKALYFTMTDTDFGLYELTVNYDTIVNDMKGTVLEIAADKAPVGTPITIPSGYFVRKWTCNIDKYVYRLKEGQWIWKDSTRYSQPGCETIHGTSGAPIIDSNTHKVIGVNNTGNDSGGKCTFNNPCEENEQGEIYYRKGLSYGQHTDWVLTCLDGDNRLVPTKQGCLLPKP